MSWLRAFALLTFLAAPIFGAAFAVSARHEGGLVIVNEMRAFRFATGKTSSRASAAAAVLAKAKSGATVKAVKRSRKSYQVRIGNSVIATISQSEAKAQSSTPSELANQWAAKIREALALPPLVFGQSSIKAPVGGAARVNLMGSGALKAKLVTGDGEILKARRISGGVEVRGLRLGSGTVSAQAGGETAVLSVSVLPYAVRLPQTVTVSVTGSPALTGTVQGAIQRALNTQLGATPDAKVTFTMPAANQLQSGRNATYKVSIKADGPESISSEGVAQITVRNVALPKRSETELWYSNDPENLQSFGALFAGELAQDSPTRLLYHHINMMSSSLTLQVYALNTSDQPARLAIMPGDGDVSKNPVLAGCKAGDRFIRNWMFQSGEVITLPPHTGMPISIHRLGPRDTASGLCTLWLLSGGAKTLSVRVDAKPRFETSEKWAEAMLSPAPWRIVGVLPYKIDEEDRPAASPHIYPDPFRDESVVYRVGGNLGFVRIGENAIGRQDGQSELSGNFGVCYRISARFENLTSAASDCELVYEASAGYSGGVFAINGTIVQTPMLQPKGQVRLARVRLEPGAFKVYSVITFPLSGCSYPATLTLRPVDFTAPIESVKGKKTH